MDRESRERLRVLCNLWVVVSDVVGLLAGRVPLFGCQAQQPYRWLAGPAAGVSLDRARRKVEARSITGIAQACETGAH